jgi:di/tricarboxylate transporter
MKRRLLIFVFVLILSFFISENSWAQCSICTKTAQQLGEKPAKGLNSGILYLAFMPLAIVGVIGYRWWRSNKDR